MTDTYDKEGGPAFPSGRVDVVKDVVESPLNDGMSLRDWFAGQILSGGLANPESTKRMEGLSLKEVAEHVYALADAMLAARKQEEGQ